jgi:PhnB protein
MYVPAGFSTIFPYFFVKDAPHFLDFLVDGLGGTVLQRSLRPDGNIANAQVQLGTSHFMVSEASDHYPPMPAAYYLYVADADAAVERALQHGAKLEMAVANMPYDDRQGGIIDPHGNIWWISQRLVDQPYD